MNNLTIQELVKLLPITQEQKDEVMKDYESFDEDKKLRVARVLWSAFYELKHSLEVVKYQEFLAEVETGKRTLSGNMIADVREAVWKDFTDVLSGKIEASEQMETIRGKLKALSG